ncbi:MAG: phosphomannomutase/phosphoglucomutase [Gammaproteobacteria bacterium]|nr:phosphomannomutase/phosphoglucomutase [Gammaproteobacteria bacterium]
MRAIGCEVIELFTDIDGHFPNHHPDPLKPENLEDIAHKVRETKADIGLAFDGDGDRLGVVSNLGNIIWADRVLMLLSVGVLKACPEATILYDVKCTRFLADVIESAGGKAVMSATGHSIMKRNLALTGAELGGELSGHIFFKHRWYGFDDGVYAGARLLELLTEESVDADTVFSRFPDGVSTPELNVLIPESEKFGLIDRLQQEAQARFPTAKIITLDGMRIEFSNGWALVRASNTTPNLVLRFEATTPEELKSIQDAVRDWIKAVAPQLILGF